MRYGHDPAPGFYQRETHREREKKNTDISICSFMQMQCMVQQNNHSEDTSCTEMHGIRPPPLIAPLLLIIVMCMLMILILIHVGRGRVAARCACCACCACAGTK